MRFFYAERLVGQAGARFPNKGAPVIDSEALRFESGTRLFFCETGVVNCDKGVKFYPLPVDFYRAPLFFCDA